MKRKVYKVISAVLTVGWMAVIYCFSAQNGEVSSDTSGRLVRLILSVLRLDPKAAERLTGTLTFIVRKGAHFSEYLILGLLLFLLFRAWTEWMPKKIAPAAWIISACYAASDELHQRFTAGRSPQLRDVCIDCAGAALGILIILTITLLRGKKDEKHIYE